MISENNITLLKSYLGRQDIAFAFLFGSQARGTATAKSDVDIAVYFYPKERRPIEYEGEVYYPAEHELWAGLERTLNREIELLVLNRAPASIAASAIRGLPLAIKDWGLYLDFMETITSEAEDFMDFVINDFMEKAAIGKGV